MATIFFLVFLLFCSSLIPTIFSFHRHRKNGKISLLILTVFLGAVMVWFFVDIPNGIDIVNTEIELNSRNTSTGTRGQRPTMLITGHDGRTYYRNMWPSYVPVRITYLRTSRFIMRVERYFPNRTQHFVSPEIFGINAPISAPDGFREIYHHGRTIILFIFILPFAIIIVETREAIGKKLFSTSKRKKKHRPKVKR